MFISVQGFSQNGNIIGVVKDSKTKETLVGVNIVVNTKTGTITDIDGKYKFNLPKGKYTIEYNFIGYKTEIKIVELHENENLTINVFLNQQAQLIDEVVVSAGKFEQKLSDITVSMDVIKPEKLENNNTRQMDEVMKQIPGVDIMDGQPSIRGGSGYSYGAGSRVLILVDDLPMLSADVGDAKWNYIPVENVSQIEVIKGAASALYGSSALNGVINIRTAYPGDFPKTKITMYTGMYMNPERKELIWWGKTQPMFSGLSYLHTRKIGNLDFTVGGNFLINSGYRENNGEEHARTNINLRYRDKKIKGLSYGINGNIMEMDKTDFFLWQNADSGAWRQNPDGISETKGYRRNLDPYITYFDNKGNKHSLRTRYFGVSNEIVGDSLKNSFSDLYYAEYQYQKNMKNNYNGTFGISGSYAEINALLFGNHYSSNSSIYGQIDKKIKKLTLSGGVRAEYYKIDQDQSITVLNGDTINNSPVIPVFRMGANYNLFKYTFLRASFGQGYRFPSIAEKYTYTNLGALTIFPNPKIQPEKGWSAELGLKQGFKLADWNGFIDFAGFWTEYSNMMEYTFGFYDTLTFDTLTLGKDMITLDNIGFQSRNVGYAQITGVDISINGAGKILGIPTTLMLGYTYTNPIDLTVDMTDTLNSSKSNILKYRYYHSIKGDVEFKYLKFSTGFSFVYNSFIINIDEAFQQELIQGMPSSAILPGLKEYREKHNKGILVIDYRVSFSVTEFSKLSLMVKNITNKEYMGRPGDIQPPRNLALQYVLNF